MVYILSIKTWSSISNFAWSSALWIACNLFLIFSHNFAYSLNASCLDTVFKHSWIGCTHLSHCGWYISSIFACIRLCHVISQPSKHGRSASFPSYLISRNPFCIMQTLIAALGFSITELYRTKYDLLDYFWNFTQFFFKYVFVIS